MKTKIKKTTRRSFIKKTGAGLAAAALPGLAPFSTYAASTKGKTRVVLVRNQDVVTKKGKIDRDIAGKMLDQAMTALLNRKNKKQAWQRLFKSKDIVGIKSNVWRNLPTPGEIENAIIENLESIGISRENISADDHSVIENPVFKKATVLINVRPMRTHHWSGVGGCIKNPIMFVNNPYAYHDDFCAPLGQMWKDAGIVGKVKLNILVMFTPLFHGIGPHHYDTKYVWHYCGLLASLDPVAVDTVGREILRTKRKQFFKEERPFKPIAHHIEIADKRYGLGTSDLKKIKLVKLGWEKDRLI
jgi:hypothetical protein